MKPKQDFYPNQVNPDFRVEVREDRKAFDPERLRCSAIIAESLGTFQIGVYRKEQYNRVYPQTWTPIDNQSQKAFYRGRTQNK